MSYSHYSTECDEYHDLVRDFNGGKPEIVCLCGSTRFYAEFQKANYELTMQGKIVLSVGFFFQASEEAHSEQLGCSKLEKIALDELHKRKIDLCDTVFVLNVGGYIGESTRSEVNYAKILGRPIKYLEPLGETQCQEKS